MLSTPGSPAIRDNIISVFGAKQFQQLVEIPEGLECDESCSTVKEKRPLGLNYNGEGKLEGRKGEKEEEGKEGEGQREEGEGEGEGEGGKVASIKKAACMYR